jgi:hypothetical protein
MKRSPMTSTSSRHRDAIASPCGRVLFQTFDSAIRREGDMLHVLDVPASQVGIRGIFSDWPATTTFYANCAGLR